MQIIKLNKPDLVKSVLKSFPKEWRNNFAKEHLHALHVITDVDLVLGRIGIYLNDYYIKEGIAFLGAYECIQDIELSNQLLNSAIHDLTLLGIKKIYGPIDGSTWNNYRFKENSSKDFFMEPSQAHWYPDFWKGFGFKDFQAYQSRILNLELFDSNHINGLRKELENKNIKFRHLDHNNIDKDLDSLARFNLKEFENSLLYSPVNVNSFKTKYKSILHLLDLELILLAELEDELVGFVFMLPDLKCKKKEKCIIKTIAKKKDKKYNKLAWFMSHYVQMKAKEKGFKYVIHALMRDDNASVKLSLFEKTELYSTYKLLSYEMG